MPQSITIELKSLRFFAFHGVYSAEKKTGNEFEVDFTVSFIPQQGIITDIAHTINYVSIHSIIKKQMQQPRELLETLAMETVEAVQAAFPQIDNAYIRITKLHAPITAFEGTVGVEYKWRK